MFLCDWPLSRCFWVCFPNSGDRYARSACAGNNAAPGNDAPVSRPSPISRYAKAITRIVTLSLGLTIVSSLPAADRHPALSPQEALASFQLEPGLRIELVAAEPLVIDPVALAFDERGRLFVVEGRGYPDPVEGGGKTTEGRIVLLEDTDGDGRYDRRREFASGLGYVNGIAAWRGGIFVTSAPDILYLK